MIRESPRSASTVWIIDDDETALLLAHEVLTDAGFQVRTFANASNALAAVQTHGPDIVVVDVLMPGMDGFEFCRRFRQLPECAVIPVLVTTLLDDTESIDRACRAGATNFATKPVNWTVEVHRLDYMLRSAKIAGELLQKEHETRLAKEEWERTFDSIADVVTVLDKDFRVLRANRAATKFFAAPVEAIVGRFCHELFHGDKACCANCPGLHARTINAPATAEVRIGPEGKFFEVSVSPVRDPEGQITHFVHVARDLSEKKELEAELRHAQKMEAVGTLAGGIAHDFNNMLMVIQCSAELLVADLPAPSEELDSILEATRRGSALAKQLLLFSRKGAAVSQKHPVNLGDLVLNVIRMLDKGLAKSVTLRRQLPAGVLPVLANPEQIEQILMNLAVNAAHAMPNGGELTFATQDFTVTPEFAHAHPNLKPGHYVQLAVSDTGHGMDRETLERIYEPFFTTKKIGEGTGLGLAVVFGIVQDHAGVINCESEPGVGTTFTIYLPAVGKPSAQPPSLTATSAPPPRGSETILVVDDEPPICRMLERHLVRLGYTVMTATGGRLALEKYKTARQRPHAVILDLGMPDMNGWKCMEELRAFDPGAKIVVTTGYGGENVAAEARKRGAAGLLAKPYQLANFSQTLRDILDSVAAKAYPETNGS